MHSIDSSGYIAATVPFAHTQTHVVYKIVAEEEEMSQEGGDSGGREVEEGARTEGDDGDVIRRQLVTLSCVGVGFSNVSKGIMCNGGPETGV